MVTKQRTIAVLGGTGDLGRGLVYRWSRGGHRVIIGSRSVEKANEAVDALRKRLPDVDAVGADNATAASLGDIVAVSVPFKFQSILLNEIKEYVQGKVFIDTTVCLVPPRVDKVNISPHGSAGMIAQEVLGENVKVVSAFQNIAASHLDSDHEIYCDVLVCGNDEDARSQVIELAQDAGMKAWHAGQIENSVAVEGMTSVLIALNKRYKIAGAGVVVTTGAKG